MMDENRNIPLDGTASSVLWSQNCLNLSIRPELNLKGPFIYCATQAVSLFIAQTNDASAAHPSAPGGFERDAKNYREIQYRE